MFMFKTAKFLQELRQFSPEIFSTTQQSVSNSQRDMNFIRVGQDIFKHCPSDSIDYAVMEKTHDAVVIPIDAGWSDVGSWSSLWEVSKKDHLGNVNVGEIISIDSNDN